MTSIRIIRPLNLLIIALIQGLVQYAVIVPRLGGELQLFDHWQVVCMMIITMCAGAAGYIVNDIYDVRIDALNKPGKNVIPSISEKAGWIIYGVVVAVGAALTFALGEPYAVKGLILYAATTVVLWAYSAKFKLKPLVGNLIVSLFAGLVVYVIWLGQSVNLTDAQDPGFARNIVIMYSGFAFLATLVRELVKDAEDLIGDARFGAKTLPIVAGMRTTKLISMLTLLLLAALLLLWIVLYSSHISTFAWAFLLVAVTFPLLHCVFLIYRAHGSRKWHFLSQYLKLIMLMGTLFLLFV